MYLVQYISDSAYGLMWPSLRLLHHHPKLPVCHTDLEAKRDHRHVPVTYLFSEHDTLDFPATMGVQSSWESQGTPQNRFYCYNPDHNARTASLPATPAPGNFTRIQLQEAQTNEYWPRCQHYEGSMGDTLSGLAGPDLFISSTGQFRETYNLIAEMPAEPLCSDTYPIFADETFLSHSTPQPDRSDHVSDSEPDEVGMHFVVKRPL
ncbi:hypothetical protein F4604DRAFT_1686591 [Suillus subluteus]|nr:hypothetical protein F4604DRAFT_1686591 [Suillus subluteus]